MPTNSRATSMLVNRMRVFILVLFSFQSSWMGQQSTELRDGRWADHLLSHFGAFGVPLLYQAR